MQRRDSTNCCVLQERDPTPRYMMQRRILQNIFAGLSAVNTTGSFLTIMNNSIESKPEAKNI
jgi:hypothetical protein